MMLLPHLVFMACLLGAAWYQFVHVGMRQLSVATLLLTLLVLIHGIPMLVYLHLTGPDTFIYEAALGVVDREAVLSRVLIALSLMFVCLILGMTLANALLDRWRRQGRAALRAPARGKGLERRVFQATTYTRLFMWGLGLWMLAVMLLDGVPMKVVDYFRTEGLEFDKILLRREFGSIDNYFYNVTLSSVAPFICAVALILATRKFALVADKILAVALLCIVLLGKFGTLSKAPPVIFILQLLLLWFLATGRRINFRNLLVSAVVIIALFALMVRAVVTDLDTGSTLAFLYYRVFDITNEGLIEFFAAYPASIPHGWGSNLLAMFGDAPPRVPSYFAVAALTRADSFYDSSSNSLFIADAWAEYAWLGVVFTSTLAGFWTRAIDLYAFRHGRTDEAVCIVAACAFGVFTMLSTSFPTALITGGLALIPVVSTLFVRKRAARRFEPAHREEVA